MRLLSIIISLTFLSKTMVGQDSLKTTYSLQQCVETALANNLDVSRANILMQGGKINWNQARLNMLPDLNANGSLGVNQGRSINSYTNEIINDKFTGGNYGLNSNLLLFNGLSLQHASKQQSLAYEATKMDWQQAKDNITIQVILAYLQVLTNQELYRQAESQLAVSKNQVERLTILDNDGAAIPLDFSDLKGQYARDRLSIISVRNALETSRLTLSQLMNRPYDSKLGIEQIDVAAFTSKYEDAPEAIYQTALKQFAQIRAVELKKESAQQAVKSFRGRLYPQLGAYASTGSLYNSTATRNFITGTRQDISDNQFVLVNGTPSKLITMNDVTRSEKIGYSKQLSGNISTSFGLNLQIPLFNALVARNRVKLAKLDLKLAEQVETTTKTQLQQSIEQSYLNMTTASDRFKTLMEQVAAYKESFRIAEVKFNSGVGTSVDYLTAKNNLDQANINLISARYDFVLRTKILDYYQGKQLW